MANIQKTLTYSLPDVMYSSTTDLGKTSTMNYDGPSEIVLWIDKETGYLEQCHCHEEEPDCPLPDCLAWDAILEKLVLPETSITDADLAEVTVSL